MNFGHTVYRENGEGGCSILVMIRESKGKAPPDSPCTNQEGHPQKVYKLSLKQFRALSAEA